MKKCPYCAEIIEDESTTCPVCNESLNTPGETGEENRFGYEYKTKAKIFGLPWIHISFGQEPATGRKRPAKGVIAIGNIARGVIAVGGVAVGGITIGGFSIGLLAFGGLSLGVGAIGLIALAAFIAIGLLAASPFYAIGILAFARNSIGINGVDQWFLRQVEKVWTVIGPRDPTV